MKPTKILLTAVLSTGILLGGTLAYTGQFIFETQAATEGAPVAARNSQDSDSHDSEPSKWHNEIYEDVIVMEGNDPFQLVADQLGLSLDELMDKLDEGKSIADLAQENNIDPQTIVEAIAAEETKWLEQMVADEEIDAETADDIRKGLITGATEIVNGNHMLFFGDCDLAMFDSVMLDGEMPDGVGIDVQIFDGVEWIDEAVAAEEMTAEEAALLKKELAELAADEMDEPWEHEDIEIVTMHGGMMMDPMGSGVRLDVAAQTLGIAEDDLFEMLVEGKTVASIADEKGITSESVIDAMTAAARDEITDFVQNGWPAGMPCSDVVFEAGS